MLSHEPSIPRSDLTHTELNTLIGAVPREPRHLSFLIDAETTAATFCRTLLGEAEGNAHCPPQNATDLGGAVLRLLERLYFLIEHNSEQHRIINALALSIGLWVAKRQGAIREMELIVTGLAMAANGTLERCELEALYEVSLHILHAANAFLKADIDKQDDHRPWRLLCLNHCIIATRSGNGELAKASYDLLITHLPEEAKAFFEMGTRKVNGQQYSPHCRNIMRAYYEMYCGNAQPQQRTAVHWRRGKRDQCGMALT